MQKLNKYDYITIAFGHVFLPTSEFETIGRLHDLKSLELVKGVLNLQAGIWTVLTLDTTGLKIKRRSLFCLFKRSSCFYSFVL